VPFEEDDSGRVVAAIFETLEAVQQQRLGGATPDVSDDPAHSKPSFFHPAESRKPPRNLSLETQKPG
jgi:hypothetical protein